MGYEETIVERRRAVVRCDGCDVREVYHFDSGGFSGGLAEPTLQNDWASIWIGPRSSPPMVFHSRDCLLAYFDKELARAYPESKAKVG